VGADDFQCLREVLRRRFERGLAQEDLPDLLVVDGGKGQLSVAVDLLEEMGLQGRLHLASLAKERPHKRTTERIFVPGRSDPLPLPQDSSESLYLQQIRDEAHRFAVRYHRELRRKKTLRTGLEGIAGIGRKRRQAILDAFGTLRRIREASDEEIAAVVGPKLARAIREKLGGR